jgi:Ni/Co efflux regulator RcnB
LDVVAGAVEKVMNGVSDGLAKEPKEKDQKEKDQKEKDQKEKDQKEKDKKWRVERDNERREERRRVEGERVRKLEKLKIVVRENKERWKEREERLRVM